MTEDDAVRRQKWLARGVSTLVVLSVDEDYRSWSEELGTAGDETVREAIRAVLTLCDVERRGSMASLEVRTRIRQSLNEMEAAMSVGGVTDDVRRHARTIVQVMFPDARKWFGTDPQRE